MKFIVNKIKSAINQAKSIISRKKSTINKIIISGVVAFLFFHTVNTDWLYFSVIYTCIWILLLLNFTLSKNKSFFKAVYTVNSTVLGIYCINQLLENGIDSQSKADWGFFVWVSALTIGVVLYRRRSNKNTQGTNTSNASLLGKREKDLQRLITYTERFDIIGLNGRWGTGKSFLITELKERIKDEYEFIEIDIMTCNLNEMQPTLIKAFEELMFKNRILPKYSNKVKNNITSSSMASKLQDITNLIFLNTESNSEIIHEFQKELAQLDKTILVIYEDIDRISNKDVVGEIFSISEKLSNENIKIIYQYDERILEEMGFDAEYLEKYIPFKMNLTELHFWEVLEFVLKDVNDTTLSVKDFSFIRYPRHFNVLNDFFDLKNDYTLNMNYASVRKVKNLVKEIVMILNMKKELYLNHKDTVISFFILKHLHAEAYKKLHFNESLLEVLKFSVDDKEYTIFQLIELYNNEKNSNGSELKLIDLYNEQDLNSSKIEKAFNQKENQTNYALLKLFNYEIIKNKETDESDKPELVKHRNEKIDRILWNLLSEGKSEFTDNENAVNKFEEYVLSKPLDEQKELFQKFQEHFFHSDSVITDNTTIFKIGNPYLVDLFKSFKMANMDNERQIKLIDFYFHYNDNKKFTLDVITCMNYCPLNSRKEYLRILRYLTSLEVIGNLSKNDEFIQFLKIYIHALSKLGFISSYRYFYGIDDFRELMHNKIYIRKSFDKLLGGLEEKKSQYTNTDLPSIVKDLDTIIQFIEKIIEILTSDEEVKREHRSIVNSKVTRVFQNQEEYDRLKQLFESGTPKDSIIEEIEASYKGNNITIYEIDSLLQETKVIQ